MSNFAYTVVTSDNFEIQTCRSIDCFIHSIDLPEKEAFQAFRGMIRNYIEAIIDRGRTLNSNLKTAVLPQEFEEWFYFSNTVIIKLKIRHQNPMLEFVEVPVMDAISPCLVLASESKIPDYIAARSIKYLSVESNFEKVLGSTGFKRKLPMDMLLDFTGLLDSMLFRICTEEKKYFSQEWYRELMQYYKDIADTTETVNSGDLLEYLGRSMGIAKKYMEGRGILL
ncbi:MAG: hypothetical protein HFG39_16270 [Lachnospiraceae bacterium]|nr:hypothetical protein [Lachnospiraceae bacterium]